MNIMDLCYYYGQLNDMRPIDVRKEYDAGLITEYELFDAFLAYIGITGWTQTIVTAFRICYKLN